MISPSLQSLKTRPFLKWIKRHWREGRTRYLQNNVNKIPQKFKFGHEKSLEASIRGPEQFDSELYESFIT